MINLTEEQKNNIISECINTRKTFGTISIENGINIEQLYLIIEEYCKENNYVGFRRTREGIVFENSASVLKDRDEKDLKKIFLEYAIEIDKWCKKNERKPNNLAGVKVAKKGEEETAEQKEKRISKLKKLLQDNIVKKYKGRNLEEIEDETEKEIVKIIREIDKKYRNSRDIGIRARKIYLRNLEEILDWKEVNKRKPKIIYGVRAAKKGEKETEEQKERRLARSFKKMKDTITKLYDNISLEDIYNENDREIVRIIRKLEEEWEKTTKKEKDEEILNKARKLETWCIANGRRPRCLEKVKAAKKGERETPEQKEKRMYRIYYNLKKDIEKYDGKNLEGIEDKVDREIVKIIKNIENKYEVNVGCFYKKRSLQDSKYLKNAMILKEWCIENGRRPRSLDRVKVAKKGEEETAEQKEKRMSVVWHNINKNVVKKYEGISLENIKDKVEREITRIIRELTEIYPKNKNGIAARKENLAQIKTTKKRGKAHFVKTVGNEKMKKMIVNLIKTKNATEEQIKVIADFYGVDMGKVINEKDER